VVAFLRRMEVGLAPLNQTAAWATTNEVRDWRKAGVYYLKTFPDRWKGWAPADVAVKVQAALGKEP